VGCAISVSLQPDDARVPSLEIPHRTEVAYRNDLFSVAFLSDENVGYAMYPWPIGEFDSFMDDALNIASAAAAVYGLGSTGELQLTGAA
jgi:hypothetical protein